MSLDHYYLNFAYQLALQNEGNTAPNPSVGAVVVRGDQIAGYGCHSSAGEAHAEIVAMHRAGDRARNATLYCSLEPCGHQGKTPPCTDQIRQAGISRVVYGTRDQNPVVNGKGHETLERSGIRVDRLKSGVIDSFYEPFFHSFRAGRPYVIIKAAMTVNGIISPADRNSRWITNETSLSWVHQLRAGCHAILVGADTVILDRPHLTVRAEGISRSPMRVVLDSRFKLDPADCSLLESDAPILICGSENAPAGKEEIWHRYGVSTLRFRNTFGLLTKLLEIGVRKMIVEGGQKIFTSFHTAGVIDEYVLMVAPRILTGRHFLNVFGGPEQSLSETIRYQIDPPLELDGDFFVRMRKKPDV